MSQAEHSEHLKRSLSVRDLTVLAIAAIIGAGIFSTIGNAASSGGPAVSMLFVFTAIACCFSALCYAEFAANIPVSGSAYTYSYASFGEIAAWIMGWVLIMEYAFGNIAVAISWSEYFCGFLAGFNIHIPDYLSVDYFSAFKNYNLYLEKIQAGTDISAISQPILKGYTAYLNAPRFIGLPVIMNIPAFGIVVMITTLVYIGIQQTKRAGNIMVVVKISVLLLVIAVGAFYVKPENWTPFAPNGIPGVLKGVAAVFFAFIGFDAISTTAEECKHPRRDIPRAMFYSLGITALLYVAATLVLTGILPYHELGTGNPMAYAFERIGLSAFSGVIAFGAVIAMAGVLLVFQVGQPRIWMSMSRDGLLPKQFSKVHPKFKTPSFATLVTGFVVSIPVLFMNLTEVTDLTSIGTLFAFVLVCGGILFLNKKELPSETKKFSIPYINSRYIFTVLLILMVLAVFIFRNELFFDSMTAMDGAYILALLIIVILSIFKRLSFIPVFGVCINLYLMSRIDILTWKRFGLWILIGIVIYFLYGYRKSKLRAK